MTPATDILGAIREAMQVIEDNRRPIHVHPDDHARIVAAGVTVPPWVKVIASTAVPVGTAYVFQSVAEAGDNSDPMTKFALRRAQVARLDNVYAATDTTPRLVCPCGGREDRATGECDTCGFDFIDGRPDQ